MFENHWDVRQPSTVGLITDISQLLFYETCIP